MRRQRCGTLRSLEAAETKDDIAANETRFLQLRFGNRDYGAISVARRTAERQFGCF